jgi:hypothetical protein
MLTEKELRQKLWINRGTVLKLRKQGLPHIKIGRLIRYDLNDVLTWLKANSESYQHWEGFQAKEEGKGIVNIHPGAGPSCGSGRLR